MKNTLVALALGVVLAGPALADQVFTDAQGNVSLSTVTMQDICVNDATSVRCNTLVGGVNHSGRVGIKTQSPASELDVNGTLTVSSITVEGTLTGSGALAVASACVGSSCTLPTDGTVLVSSGPLLAQSSSTSSGAVVQSWRSAAGSVLGVWQQDGKVGVGTASPIAKLHVAGDSSITGATTFGSSATVKGNLEASAATTVDLLIHDTAGAVGGWRLRAGNASANDAAFGSGNFTPYMGFNTTAAAEMNITATGGFHVTPASTYNSSGTWKNIVAATTFTITNLSSPAAADACTAGTITVDTAYIYVCSASGAWKRAALTGGY